MIDDLKYYGVIVFTTDFKSVIIVESTDGIIGFPKGKIKKNETTKQCALRELFEETGIVENQIKFIDLEVVEKSTEGKSIGYYVAHPINDQLLLNFSLEFDSAELNYAKWILFEDLFEAHIFAKMKSKRQQILKYLHMHCTNQIIIKN
jgi:8-oxo-dGTP pyrophosphatase MutT (NUDIX family)